MNITIHRGADQIGGCVTEISTEKARIFIDLGADLTKDEKGAVSPVNIDGLTTGNAKGSVLLLTHYHCDHTGRLPQTLPEIPIYMGETARKINMVFSERMVKAKRLDKKYLEFLEKARTFKPADKLEFGNIKVTPIMIDHSAFDAYSFIIEANGKKIFYTGDFRLHGPRGKIKVFEHYVKNIDYLICEGTNISRTETAQTESELQKEAIGLFRNPKHKYVFIFCPSTNIDRIFVFYKAYYEVFKGKKPFVCDSYQKKLLEIVKESHSKFSEFYDFDKIYSHRANYEKLNKWMNEKGFCRLIRSNDQDKKIVDEYFAKYQDECLVIYSMWKGYLDESNKAKNEKLIDFFSSYPYKCLHTSGHADVESLKKVVEVIKPKHIIPIHTEKPDEFKNLFENTILLENGIVLYAVK